MTTKKLAKKTPKPKTPALWEPYFTADLANPFQNIEAKSFDAVVIDAKTKEEVYRLNGVEAPAFWSQRAVDIAASKYFVKRGIGGDPARGERSVFAMVKNLAATIAWQGEQQGYFDATTRGQFETELAYLLIHQYGAFNSPVWFNVRLSASYGIEGSGGNFAWNPARGRVEEIYDAYARPQVSACYIMSIEDTLVGEGGIMDVAAAEARLFKYGSGSGLNFSNLREKGSKLSLGGSSSGVISFLKILDTVAGSIKSGGTSRRAAKIVVLNVSHPDIREFIAWKTVEEKKVHALLAAGFSGGMEGEAYTTVTAQNANNSVRVPDAFMAAVRDDKPWNLVSVVDGTTVATLPARQLWREIAVASHFCADPGLQFDTTINDWNTTPNAGRINGSNPCSEYMHLDHSACNLASLRVTKFRGPLTAFDVPAFTAAAATFALAQDILVDYSSYPTAKIAEGAHRFRQLGLGYADLGAWLMSLAVPYASKDGQQLAAAVTSLMTAEAYCLSARIAAKLGPFDGYAADREGVLRVMTKHLRHAQTGHVTSTGETQLLHEAAVARWETALELVKQHGLRNAQLTLLAPTGTIGFLMDCDTTGVEPMLAHVQTKTLAGGGTLKIVNGVIGEALRTLGYPQRKIEAIEAYVLQTGGVDGAPDLDPKDLEVFDTAFISGNSARYLAPEAHLNMMAAVQPFLSGAISKCVVGDTLLATDRGLLRIGALHENAEADTFRPLDLRVASRNGVEAAAEFYYNGVQPTVRATLGDGRSLRGTAAHRVLVAGERELAWKTLGDLQPGDWVALSLGTEMWGTDQPLPFAPRPVYGSQHKHASFPSAMTPDLGLFLGMLTADGHVTSNNYVIGITKNCDAVLRTFIELAKKLFNVDAKEITDSRNGVRGATFASKAICEFLAMIGFNKQTIPDVVLSASRSTVLAYVSGLYLDGWVRPSVSISQKHASLISDLQQVWHNLGVHTYVTANPVNGVNYPVLHVSAGFRRRAANLLTWLEPHKQQRAADLSDGDDRRVFPYPLLREDLKDAIRAQKLTQQFRTLFDPRTQNIQTQNFTHAADAVKLAYDTETARYTYVPVTSVTSDEPAPVFDLSVPGSTSYVANGIVSHNTVNIPAHSTVEDIERLHMRAWSLGLKSIAVYRDNCKTGQPVTSQTAAAAAANATPTAGDPAFKAGQRKLPKERRGTTWALKIEGQKIYIHSGEYEDGTLGEVFVDIAKEGSTLGGLVRAFAKAISIGLQYRVPLDEYLETFTFDTFEPHGSVQNHKTVKLATSITDLIMRVLGVRYAGRTDLQHVQPDAAEVKTVNPPTGMTGYGPPCPRCQTLTQRNGSCHRCPKCGETTGCS